jgi:transposase
MKSYSEDLRKKIVAAVERGMSKSETARLFGVSLSSIKRYVGMASSGESLAPKKRPGRTPKVDQSTKRLLDEDMKERPAATIAERIRFLESVTGKRFSYSTIRRALKRLG